MTSKVQPAADYCTIEPLIIVPLTEKTWGRGCIIEQRARFTSLSEENSFYLESFANIKRTRARRRTSLLKRWADNNRNKTFGINGHKCDEFTELKLRLQTKIKLSSGKVGLKLSPPLKTK